MFASLSVWMCDVMCGCMERRQEKKEVEDSRKKVALLSRFVLFKIQNENENEK